MNEDTWHATHFFSPNILGLFGRGVFPTVTLIDNYKKGIGTSISSGIRELDLTVKGAMIIPADMPIKLITSGIAKSIIWFMAGMYSTSPVLRKYRGVARW